MYRAAIILLLPIVGCRITGPVDDFPAIVPVLVESFTPTDVRGAPYTIESVAVRGSILEITVRYEGGCTDHDFAMYSHGAIIKTLPPGADLYLAHISNGDACESLQQQQLQFDLTSLSANEPEEILLFVWPWEQKDFIDPPLRYKTGR